MWEPHWPIDILDPVADHPLNHGLAAWWPGLDGQSGGRTAFDAAGISHATLSSDTTWLSGVGQFAALNVPVGAVGQPTPRAVTGPTFTVSGWAQATSLGAGVYGSVLFGIYRSNALGEYTFVNFSGTSVALWSYAGSGSEYHAGTAFGSSVNNQWKYYTFVRTGNSGNYYLYIDGVLIGSTTSGAAWITGGVPYLHIGGRPDVAGCAWGGPFADVRVYSRSMDAGEAAALYDQARRGHPDTLRRWSPRVRRMRTPETAFNPAWAYGSNRLFGGGVY